MSDLPFVIRDFNPFVRGEEAYLYQTWLRDLHDADPSGLPDDLWFGAHRQHIKNVLGDRQAVCLVAVASDQPTEILGYVVGVKGSHLEWVHVRPGNLRGKGLAKLLLTAADMTPMTPARFMTKLGKQKLLNPFRGRQLRKARRA